MTTRRRLAAFALAAVTLGGCTSSGTSAISSAPPTQPSSGTRSSGTASTATTSAPPSSSGPPTGLQTIRGALLLLGRPSATVTPVTDVYEVAAGGLHRLTTVSSGVSELTADATHVVVTDSRTRRIAEVRSGALHDLGTGAGFTPDLSSHGALAWASVDVSSQTPGITKPKAFVVEVRPSLRGRSRVVYRTRSSLASPEWLDAHALVVGESDGTSTKLVRIDTTSGRHEVLATLRPSDALTITAGPTAITAGDDSGAVIVALDSGAQAPVPSGWTPLCWLSGSSLLAANGGGLARIAVAGHTPGRPRMFGTLPAGLDAYGAACARVGR